MSVTLFYFQKLNNLTKIPKNFILCKSVQCSKCYDDSKTVEHIY